MFLIRLLFSFVVLFSINSSVVCAQEDIFPFVAQVTESSVNVRAGQSRNFAKINQLSEGDEVLVLGKEYSWYKIQLLSDTKSYISSKFISMSDANTATVTGSRVNVRAKPDVNSVILTQVKEGDQLTVLAFDDQWATIIPPNGTVGWVSDQFLKYTTKDTALYVEPEVVHEKQQEEQVVVVEQLPEPQTVKFDGLLKEIRYPTEQGQDAQYKVISTQNVTYQLKGLKQMLDQYVNYQVKLEGEVDESSQGISRHPVLKVSSIEIIL